MRRPRIWKDFVTILLLFIILTMAIVYTRDQLLALRHSPGLLNHQCRLAVTYFGLHRRGCRAGAHWRRRVAAARGLTSERTTTSAEIPTVSNVHCAVVINNELLTSYQGSAYRECVPLSTSYYDDTHRSPQPVADSATTLPSTCVWAAVPESHWANFTELCSPYPVSAASFQQPSPTPSSQRTSQPMSPFSLSQSAGTANLSVHSAQCRPNLASTPKFELLQTQVDSHSLSLNACSLSDCNLLSPAVTDSPPTSPSSVQCSISTLSDYCVDALFDPCLADSKYVSRAAVSPKISSAHSSALSVTHNRCMPTVFAANLRGGFCAKYDELYVLLQQFDVDIACFTETWLNSAILPNLTDFTGYITYRLDRSDGRQGGGIAVVVKNDLPCHLLRDLSKPPLETLWLLFRRPRMPRTVTHLLIGCIYHPPSANNSVMSSHIMQTLDFCSKKHPFLGVILIGDFNKFSDSELRSYPLSQVVKGATRQNATLDKIYTNLAHWFISPEIKPPVANSDHNSVLFRPSTIRPRTNGFNRLITRRSINTNGKTLLAHAIEKMNWSSMYQLQSVDAMLLHFNSTIHKLLDTYLPYVTFVNYSTDKPWITQKFRQLICSRQQAFHSGDMTSFRKFRNEAQRLAKQLRSEYYGKKIDHLARSDSRSWWRKTREFLNEPVASSYHHLLLPTPDCSLAETLNSFFASVAADLQPLQPDLCIDLGDNDGSQYVIEPWQVALALNGINTQKAIGPDYIPNWFLKEFAPWLAQPVCAIFNQSLVQHTFPHAWKSADVIPIPKVNPPKFIESDLRPISLLPTLAKVCESIVGRWLLDVILPTTDPNQFGALRGRSTSHALVSMLHQWCSTLDAGGSARVLFVDFAKAFDRVDHNLLIRKFLAKGVPHFLIKWLHSFLSNRVQRVRLPGELSTWTTLSGGMPQGSWLGPLSFIVLIDDLAVGSILHKYVDDTTISELLSSTSQTSDIHSYVNKLLSWSTQNFMKINYSKTKEMLLGPLSKLNVPDLDIQDNIIERVSGFKLLGVNINNNLSWHLHVDYICARANTRLHYLKRLKWAGLPEDRLAHWYTSVIRPVLEYCAVVWHHGLSKHQTDLIEAIQRRALRIVYPTTASMPYWAALYFAGLPSLSDRRDKLCREFFHKMCDPTSCIHHLLPPPRDSELTSRLRNASVYPRPRTRTNCYKSFIHHALLKFQ